MAEFMVASVSQTLPVAFTAVLMSFLVLPEMLFDGSLGLSGAGTAGSSAALVFFFFFFFVGLARANWFGSMAVAGC